MAQYWNYQEQRLITPTNSMTIIAETASELLKKVYRQGYQYKKAGVSVIGIGLDSPIQQDLFDMNADYIQKLQDLALSNNKEGWKEKNQSVCPCNKT